MNKRHGKLKEDNVSHNGDCLPQSMLPLRPFGPAGLSPAIYRPVAWLAQETYFGGLFSHNTGESFWDFPEHPKRALRIMLQERFGPMVLSLLGRVALWDCLSGVKAPCLLQPPPEVARLFSPSPFSSRAKWPSTLGSGWGWMHWDALIADQEQGALVIMMAQTISSSTIAGLSDPSVRPSSQELARAGSLGLAVHWGAAPCEPWCPSAFSSGTCEASTLVPPLVPGASTGDLFGGAWRMGTLDYRDVNQQDGAAVVTAVRSSRRPSQWSISIPRPTSH
ncbi:hypothetical protein NEUTE1DRAFT_135691 [Neurospora tetrasperma FGSC 2508]|uniref:Uncharacterized protein n=1 Tax=Neurospora tetrasperma (strain FGSC 2508 / ATCC MYA-4615 / P0657) TaxID=510951 RepID=F8MGB4_NEUT8|nr:uncharacterized protein NEUTE1DRAFT_135691 [Neurospora tetrasperma FGSC 2508]EGO58589.1 hypothetical protein NEUTE1DRAFT_135691 [Neurospora tetrasperma FGSC 2508]